MFCIFMLLMFSATSESFNIQIKQSRIIESPIHAEKNGNKSRFFGEFLQFQNKNGSLRLVVSSPRSTKMNSSLKSDPAFGQLYSCQINLDSSTKSCDVLLANQNWSDTSGLALGVDNKENKVACNFNYERKCSETLITSPGSCSRSSTNGKYWQLLQSKNYQGAAIATVALIAYGMVAESYYENVIDRSNIRPEKQKCREELKIKDEEMFEYVDGIFVDGRKDVTLILYKQGKCYMQTVVEEHYVVVEVTGEFYLSGVLPIRVYYSI